MRGKGSRKQVESRKKHQYLHLPRKPNLLFFVLFTLLCSSPHLFIAPPPCHSSSYLFYYIFLIATISNTYILMNTHTQTGRHCTTNYSQRQSLFFAAVFVCIDSVLSPICGCQTKCTLIGELNRVIHCRIHKTCRYRHVNNM